MGLCGLMAVRRTGGGGGGLMCRYFGLWIEEGIDLRYGVENPPV